jgi:hypothetical protein
LRLHPHHVGASLPLPQPRWTASQGLVLRDSPHIGGCLSADRAGGAAGRLMGASGVAGAWSSLGRLCCEARLVGFVPRAEPLACPVSSLRMIATYLGVCRRPQPGGQRRVGSNAPLAFKCMGTELEQAEPQPASWVETGLRKGAMFRWPLSASWWRHSGRPPVRPGVQGERGEGGGEYKRMNRIVRTGGHGGEAEPGGLNGWVSAGALSLCESLEFGVLFHLLSRARTSLRCLPDSGTGRKGECTGKPDQAARQPGPSDRPSGSE